MDSPICYIHPYNMISQYKEKHHLEKYKPKTTPHSAISTPRTHFLSKFDALRRENTTPINQYIFLYKDT
jgi:hypothetical protein